MTETRGKDFNYFITATAESDFTTDPQAYSTFRGARRMMFVGVTGTNVEYSFNGVTVHGRISSGQIFNFGPRAEDKVWFKGTGTVDVHMWHIGF